jgi:hypothetical protein
MARKKSTKKPMRRKAKATKEETVEVRTPAIGDNSPGLAIPEPDDWNHHKKTIAGWREKVTTAQSHLRNAIKMAKKAGVNMESLNLVVGIERENDPAKAMQFFKQIDLGLSLGESSLRITPHDTLAGDQEELVYKRGFADGEAGRTANNQYPEGSDLAATYTRGWMHGTGKNMGQTPEQVDAAIAAQEKEAA